MNANLAKATAVGALGGLLFGFDTAVISGTTHALTITYGLSPKALGVTVAMALVGHHYRRDDRWNPRPKMGWPRDVARAGCFLCDFGIGLRVCMELARASRARFIGGLGIGGSSVLGPVYIAELAPAKTRGRSGRHFPNKYCDWNFARLFVQLPHWTVGAWRDGMAMAAWHCGNSCVSISCVALWHSSKLAVAGYAESGWTKRARFCRSMGAENPEG